MLFQIGATATPAPSSTVPVILEALAIQFQTSRIGTITRLMNFTFLFYNWHQCVIHVIFFDFSQYLPCNLCFLNCWLMPFALRLWTIQIEFINAKSFFFFDFDVSFFLVWASNVLCFRHEGLIARALAIVISKLWSLKLPLWKNCTAIILFQLLLSTLNHA